MFVSGSEVGATAAGEGCVGAPHSEVSLPCIVVPAGWSYAVQTPSIR